MATSLIDQLSIVIVDSQPADYAHLVPTMEQQGAAPQFFTRGEELLQRGVPRRTTGWLINYQLPDMSGLELCELIRQRLGMLPCLSSLTNMTNTSSWRSW